MLTKIVSINRKKQTWQTLHYFHDFRHNHNLITRPNVKIIFGSLIPAYSIFLLILVLFVTKRDYLHLSYKLYLTG